MDMCWLELGAGCLSDLIDCDYTSGAGSGRSSPVLAPTAWLPAPLDPLDPLNPDPTAFLMVDPASVVPRRMTEPRHPPRTSLKVKLEVKEEVKEEPKTPLAEPIVEEVVEEVVATPEEVLGTESPLAEDSEGEVAPDPVPTSLYIVGSKRSYNSSVGRVKERRASAPEQRTMQIREQDYPKPVYSYSCLIAMALKNSPSGSLPVSEIYNFMCEHFPYFKSAPTGWKNSVRHNLSLNKCFEKINKSANGGSRKGCLWALKPNRANKMFDEMAKWSKKDPAGIMRAMKRPETLEQLERGDMKSWTPASRSTTTVLGSSVSASSSSALQVAEVSPLMTRGAVDSEVEDDYDDDNETAPTSNESEEEEEEEDEEDDDDDDEGEVPPSLKPFDRRTFTSRGSSQPPDIGVEFTEDVYEELDLLEEVLEEAESIYIPQTQPRRRGPAKRSRIAVPPIYRQPIQAHH